MLWRRDRHVRSLHRTQLGYLVSCYYAILSALYGIGVPDGNTSTARALAVRAIEYLQYWEIAYIFAIALIKTSVGITILRIAVERRHRHSVWLVLIICNTVYAAGIIFLFASCRPMEARWNPLAGSCGGEFMMTALAYCLITLGCITDAACALIPIDIVRGLQMPRRPKCTLMVVLSLGLLAAFFSGARYPFCAYLPPQAGRLRKWCSDFPQNLLECDLSESCGLMNPFYLLQVISPGYLSFP